ncbi:aspartate aminotransferase family protein, partial [Acinetobacter baumannii]
LSAQLEKLLAGLQAAADEAGIPFKTQQAGAMFGLYFTDQEDITSFDSMLACDIEAFKKFFHGMLKRGVNLAPSAFEAGFISSAHSDE